MLLHQLCLHWLLAEMIASRTDKYWSGFQFAIFVMVGGAILAGASDLSYSLPGYIWVTICAVSTAAYLLLIRKLSDRTGEHMTQHSSQSRAFFSQAPNEVCGIVRMSC